MSDQPTKNFTFLEFACPCCGKAEVSLDLLLALQRARDIYQKPMPINSGYRCEKHNAAVGGVKGSYHVRGLAADIACASAKDRYALVSAALTAGFKGIGVYPSFVHLDLRPTNQLLFLG